MKVTEPATGEKFKLQKGTGQAQTQARFDALSCKRLAVQQAVACEAKMGHLPDEYKYNVDGSTMIIETDGKGAPMYRVVSCNEADEWEKKLLKDPLTSIRFKEGLDMGLKWMQLTNGVGDMGAMVLIVAVPGMPPGRFFRAEVQGLVFGEDSSKFGYVYFSASRCMKGLPDDAQAIMDAEERPCNPWSDYFKGPFTEAIVKLSTAYNMIDPATGLRFESVCTIDGENVVNRELLHPSVFQTLDANNISVLKNRPSCTQYDNTCDASANFRDKNTGLRHVVRNNINTSNRFLEGKLDEAFTAMRAAFPMTTMTSAHQKQAMGGILRFVYVCRSKYVTSEKSIIGARRSFQVRTPGKDLLRPIFGREESTVDALRIIKSLCYTTFADDELKNIHTHFPEMISIQKEFGRVTNLDLDRLGIAKLPDGEHKDRDALCLAQQGPVDLTHHETRQREIAYAQRHETAAAQKEIVKATALVEKEVEAARELVAKSKEKNDKARATATEKARVKALAPQQRKTDASCLAKKAATIAKKEKATKRKEEAAVKVAAAAALVNAAI